MISQRINLFTLLIFVTPLIFLGFLVCFDLFLSILVILTFTFLFIFMITPQLTLFIFGCFLLFQPFIMQIVKIGIIQFLDEFGILLLFFAMIIRKVARKESFVRTPIDFPLLSVITIGTISSLINHIVPFGTSMAGFLLFIKGFLLYYIFVNTNFEEKHIKLFLKGFLFLGILIATIGLLDFFSSNFIGKPLVANPDHNRFGFISAQSIMGHPGAFSALMAILACFNISAYLVRGEKKFLYLSWLFMVCIILSFRRTSLFGVILSFLIGLRFSSNKKLRKKAFLFTFIIIAIFLGLIIPAYKELIKNYLILRNTPRNIMTIAGLKIAKDYFPLGSGFGTFGSGITQRVYSPLYYKYRLHRIWGLSQSKPSFLNDIFWPHILAELGVTGFFFYLIIFISFFRICIKGIKELQNSLEKIFALGTFMVLIESLIESTKATFYEMSLWTYFYFGSIAIVWILQSKYSQKIKLKNLKNER